MAVQHSQSTINWLYNALVAFMMDGDQYPSPRLEVSETSDFESLLVAVPLALPPFSISPDDGNLHVVPVDPAEVTGLGVPRYFRIVNRGGIEVIRGTISEVGGDGDIQFNSTDVNVGDMIHLRRLVYRFIDLPSS